MAEGDDMTLVEEVVGSVETALHRVGAAAHSQIAE